MQSLTTTTEKGLYQPDQTLLHKLDPRLKVLSSLFLVILAFSVNGWSQLAFLVFVVAIPLWSISHLTRSVWRLCWALRWLLLFTLLLHLFFSPGHTLWGVSWLSLDGLSSGALVCVQMLLALIVSALLAITTSTENLASAFGWFVKPLQWLGCNVKEWQKLLLLSMDFIPVVHEEIRDSSETDVGEHAGSVQATLEKGWSAWIMKLQGFFSRLVDRGEVIARGLATDENSSRLPAALSPLLPMALLDRLFSLAVVLTTFCYLMTG